MKNIKFAGPSKKMADALDREGLCVAWPKSIERESDLVIEGTYKTGAKDHEKLVVIDLSESVLLDDKEHVDKAIYEALATAYERYDVDEEYERYDVDEEMEINLGVRGVLDAVELLEDCKEAEKCLKRFAEVALAIINGCPIPSKEDDAEISITGKEGSRICELLEKATKGKNSAFTCDEVALAKQLIEGIRNKIERRA